jgi:hypothetical protein
MHVATARFFKLQRIWHLIYSNIRTDFDKPTCFRNNFCCFMGENINAGIFRFLRWSSPMIDFKTRKKQNKD